MKTPRLIAVLLLSAALRATSACAPPARVPGGAGLPSALETMALPADWYPESLAVSGDGTFYVGSWHQGAIARLRPGSSRPELFVPPGSNGLANGQGLLLDAKRQLLWVCSGTLGFTTVPSTPSALKSYDLASGAPRASYPMPDQGYCNDLAQDEAGAVYVTDSLHPRVLRMNFGDGRLDTWKESSAFDTGDAYFLNGIAIDGERRMYVSTVVAKPYLLRLQIDARGRPGEVQTIVAPRTLKNADALRSLDARRVLIFESNAFGNDGPYGGAVTIATIDGGRIANLTPLVAGLNDPSSGLVFAGRVYFIESKYGLLISHKSDPEHVPSSVPFDVQSVALPR